MEILGQAPWSSVVSTFSPPLKRGDADNEEMNRVSERFKLDYIGHSISQSRVSIAVTSVCSGKECMHRPPLPPADTPIPRN